MSAIVGPIAPYSNVPIQANYYQPSRFVISAITLGFTTTVTTTVDNNYVIGQLCRLIIPPAYGCRELNESQGYVLSKPADDQVVLDIYSLGGNAYIAASDSQDAQILPIGDINSGQTNSNGPSNTTTYIPGSFINISPN